SLKSPGKIGIKSGSFSIYLYIIGMILSIVCAPPIASYNEISSCINICSSLQFFFIVAIVEWNKQLFCTINSLHQHRFDKNFIVTDKGEQTKETTLILANINMSVEWIDNSRCFCQDDIHFG